MTAPAPETARVQELYATQVVAVGALAAQLVAGGVLVLFDEHAPEELHEISVLHRPSTALAGPAPGDRIVIGDVELPVLAVGDVVADNLLQLGHLDVKADGRSTPAMPGDVCVPEGPLPEMAVGQRIRVLRPQREVAP
ncbi:MAG TPA: PTS glucitol/sorbitol transporter subunit IIA [Mycobacteriales bacterium]|nr:PTS glucitol/sorbitol transporter subunit IIA [Mycobacteriales bacterium]